jgi:CheY-like chemotaxis protein
VTTAVSVADAVRAFRRSRPTAVVSDIAMPEEDGYALIRRLRALEDGRARRTPALALTAYASADDRRRALLAGYDRHVPKPVDPPELIAAVIELVSAPEATAR